MKQQKRKQIDIMIPYRYNDFLEAENKRLYQSLFSPIPAFSCQNVSMSAINILETQKHTIFSLKLCCRIWYCKMVRLQPSICENIISLNNDQGSSRFT